MTTRNWFLGAGMGCVVGIVETVIFAKFQFSAIEPLELGVAMAVGITAGVLGTGVRVIGTTV